MPPPAAAVTQVIGFFWGVAMHCKECGAELPENTRFCKQCGAEVGDVAYQAARVPVVGLRQQVVPRAGTASILARVIMGISASVCGVMILISSFLPWLHDRILEVSISGVELMAPGGYFEGFMDGFFMMRWGNGSYVNINVVLQTGFWTIVIAVAVFVAAAFLFMNKRIGGRLSLIFGAFGFLLALYDIIVIFTAMKQEMDPYYGSYGLSAGLWVTLFFSAGLIVVGVASLIYLRE